MKKVLLISGSLPPIRCGVGYYVHKLLEELPSDIDLAVLSTKAIEENLSRTTYTVPNWKIRSLPAILRSIKASGAGIIHIQYPAVGYRRNLGINLLPYSLRLFKPRLKILITLHEYHASRWLGRTRDLITILPAHKIIISNEADMLALPKRQSRKSIIIPIGSNLGTATPGSSIYKKVVAQQKLDIEKPILLFFGFAFPDKKLEILLEALAEPELENYQALIISDFNKSSAYHSMLLSKIEGLNGTYKRVGLINRFVEGKELATIISGGQYFVLPQTKPVSAKSGTAIAAVVNGLVLVSSGSANQDETLPYKDGKNCLLVRPMTPKSLAKAISSLDGDKQARAAIARGSNELAKYFSWDSIVAKHLEVYEKL